VTYANGSPASNVYVVAVLDEEDSRAGYRILRTDGNGRYQFDGLLEGYWKVGVYKEGYGSTPPMWHESMTQGTTVTDADFVLGGLTAVTEENDPVLPDRIVLTQNYPNPFNPITSINFQIPMTTSQSHVTLKIFNMLGQEVATLVDEWQDPGSYTVSWDASDMPSGMYFYTFRAGTFTDTRPMVLMK
jgi:5-hydroxyisourate hydrolase-like protein (transthyretin family)